MREINIGTYLINRQKEEEDWRYPLEYHPLSYIFNTLCIEGSQVYMWEGAPGLTREETVKALVGLLTELDCTEEEFYCKQYDYKESKDD